MAFKNYIFVVCISYIGGRLSGIMLRSLM